MSRHGYGRSFYSRQVNAKACNWRAVSHCLTVFAGRGSRIDLVAVQLRLGSRRAVGGFGFAQTLPVFAADHNKTQLLSDFGLCG